MDTNQTVDDGCDSTANHESSAEAKANNHQQQAPSAGQSNGNSSGAARRLDSKKGPSKFQRHERYKRIDTTKRNLAQNTASRNYNHIQAEMYGSGCKGKKFRKEKGKKKRSQYSGAVIDGSVRSVRLDT